MRLTDCYNFQDSRKLARKHLPSPIFNYIDRAADDEITYHRNATFDDVNLVPNVLAGVDDIDMSVEVVGRKFDMPIHCAPTAGMISDITYSPVMPHPSRPLHTQRETPYPFADRLVYEQH